ncbi:MAG: error-prone DNA polymerase [Acidimicrobiales bacterium]|nr:error-prone DNA polymerase [Acidimicrobiales bacterium]
MGFNNPAMPWRELERRLSDRRIEPTNFPSSGVDESGFSDGPVKRFPSPNRTQNARKSIPYAELHVHSHFSFLDGASSPEELVREAARLELEALALTDHGGLYGVVRFAECARDVGLPTVFGAEITVDAWQPKEDLLPRAKPRNPSRVGSVDPSGKRLVMLARHPAGYASLSALLSRSQMAGEKNSPRLSMSELLDAADSHRGDWAILTAGRRGVVPDALRKAGVTEARKELGQIVDAAGNENVFVELWRHGDPSDDARNDCLSDLAVEQKVGLLCTNAVHYAVPTQRHLARAMSAIRSRQSLDQIDGWLPANGSAHLRSGVEQKLWFARYPGVVERSAELGLDCAFDLSLVAPKLPPYPCPDGLDEMAYLRKIVYDGARSRYGVQPAEKVAGAWQQISHELDLIQELGFPGYFLVVWDIVAFCRSRDIFCQGRGSAANSAVCYALGITNVDAVSLGLLFERFLSPERDGPPDIDLDIESGRREEVIQYVFNRYGREHTAQVANVITYRTRSAVRDAARALGYDSGQQDGWSKSFDRHQEVHSQRRTNNGNPRSIPAEVLRLASEIERAPRHLGIHSGGMVICDRPIVEVCPVEWARKTNRSVLQWDKDDCASVGLVKFDLLGLGMLSALHAAVDLIAHTHQVDVDLGALPQEDEVYDMLCRADSIGVFQVESRAQMATLPRLRPRCFYDLVVEVALIRPGPIQGGSVHPYIRRRNGEEAVTYLHPLLEPALSKTLGIPLFQEQLMQMAIDVAGFTAAEADELRQAMGSKRSRERMERLRYRLYEGMLERGIDKKIADQIWDKMVAFANYGFPESHSVSFAHLVYASSWIKHHYPAAFCAALLNSQPMGFYSPHSLVQDARRHGVKVLTPDLNISADRAMLEACDESANGVAVRLGLSSVRGFGADLAFEVTAAGPYEDLEQLSRRTDVSQRQLEALATAGAFGCFGLTRREALWAVGAVSQSRAGRLRGIVTGVSAPSLPGMSLQDEAISDLWATGIAPNGHPTRFVREELKRRGVVTAADLLNCGLGKVKVAGVVTHRQRPTTASGTVFVNLEDETGLINVIVSSGCWLRFRPVLISEPALTVIGRLERHEGVVNVIAQRIEKLNVGPTISSRDFR